MNDVGIDMKEIRMKYLNKIFTSTSCTSCSKTNDSANKKAKLPKLCLGNFAMISAFIYIALSQLLA